MNCMAIWVMLYNNPLPPSCQVGLGFFCFVYVCSSVLMKCQVYGDVQADCHLSGISDLMLSFANATYLILRASILVFGFDLGSHIKSCHIFNAGIVRSSLFNLQTWMCMIRLSNLIFCCFYDSLQSLSALSPLVFQPFFWGGGRKAYIGMATRYQSNYVVVGAISGRV